MWKCRKKTHSKPGRRHYIRFSEITACTPSYSSVLNNIVTRDISIKCNVACCIIQLNVYMSMKVKIIIIIFFSKSYISNGRE